MSKMPKYKGEISLEYAKECLVYDSITGEFTWKTRPIEHFPSEAAMKTWNTMYAGKQAFNTITGRGRSYATLKGRLNSFQINSHTMAWFLHYGKWPRNQIDHINGNSFDNRIENLRDATPLENSRNKARSKSNTSGQTGVAFYEPANKWTAYICVYGKRIHLGRFKNLHDAISARLNAERKYGFHENHGRESFSDIQSAIAAAARAKIQSRINHMKTDAVERFRSRQIQMGTR